MKAATILGIVLGGALMLNGCLSGTKAGDYAGLYKNAEARARADASYDRAMRLWDCEYAEEWVETTYGRTHIVVCGPVDAKPLFLFPGLFADAAMWYANAGDLSEKYRVLAVDLPVFGGKSVPSKKRITDVAGYAEWYSELLDHYGHEKAAVAGLSYGSWLTLALARERPSSIAAAVMLDPSETFAKMRPIMAWKGFWYFMVFPDRNKYAKFFDWLGGGYSDDRMDVWFEHMLDVIEFGSVGMTDVPQHRVYAPEELVMVTMPVLIMAGGKPIIYASPEEFSAAAARALPHAEIEIVPDTGHGLNMEKPGIVNGRVLEFLASHY